MLTDCGCLLKRNNMKLAIQGHPTRGKEVIQIFKDLGTESLMDHTGSHIDWVYFRDDSLSPNKLIVSTDIAFLKGYGYKVHTLEEFETQFPFKIGDKVIDHEGDVAIITGFAYIEEKLGYSLQYENGRGTATSGILKPYKEMKEERNITLTLDKAKEWYKKGGELKEIALQAFTEKELNPLPKSWKEFCDQYSNINDTEYFIDTYSNIERLNNVVHNHCRLMNTDKNICPSKESAESHLAMIQLEQLRNCWWNSWGPDWNDDQQPKYCVTYYHGEFKIRALYEARHFLSFPTREMAEEFLKCFKDLIEKAGDLI